MNNLDASNLFTFKLVRLATPLPNPCIFFSKKVSFVEKKEEKKMESVSVSEMDAKRMRTAGQKYRVFSNELKKWFVGVIEGFDESTEQSIVRYVKNAYMPRELFEILSDSPVLVDLKMHLKMLQWIDKGDAYCRICSTSDNFDSIITCGKDTCLGALHVDCLKMTPDQLEKVRENPLKWICPQHKHDVDTYLPTLPSRTYMYMYMSPYLFLNQSRICEN